MRQSILICGHNQTLLLTRTLVLEHAGFRVRSLSDISKLPGGAEERLFLCSSMSETEQLEAIRLTRKKWPDAKILVVGEDRLLEDNEVFRMSAFAGAEVLIENARLRLQ